MGTNILIHSEFKKDIETKNSKEKPSNISSFYTLFVKRGTGNKTKRIGFSSFSNADEDPFIYYNKDSDITEGDPGNTDKPLIIDNNKYQKDKLQVSSIHEIDFERVNENLLLFNIGTDNTINNYKDFLWLVVLYHRDHELESDIFDDQKNEDGTTSKILKKHYIEHYDSSGNLIYLKIGFVALVSELNNIHPYVDCALYFDLAPFNVMSRFERNSEHYEYTVPFIGHFHKGVNEFCASLDDDESLDENLVGDYPYNTTSLLTSANENYSLMDYFWSKNNNVYCYSKISQDEIDDSLIYISEENIYKYNGCSVYNERSYSNYCDHNCKGTCFCSFYEFKDIDTYNDVSVWDEESEIKSFYSCNIDVVYRIDTRKIRDSEKQISIKIALCGETTIDWGDGEEQSITNYEDFINGGVLKHSYKSSFEGDYADIKVKQNVSGIYISDENTQDVNILKLFINSPTLKNWDLNSVSNFTGNKFNSSINELHIYGLNDKNDIYVRLGLFNNLKKFKESAVFENDVVCGLRNQTTLLNFADLNANILREFDTVYAPSLENANSFISDWSKNTNFCVNIPLDNISTFENFASNTYLYCINIVNYCSDSSKNVDHTTFNSSFKNNESLNYLNISNICTPVSSLNSFVEDCNNLETIYIGKTDNSLSNIIKLESTNNASARCSFKNAKSLSQLNFCFFPKVMEETFSGSGLEEFDYSSEDVKAEDLEKSFESCDKLNKLSLSLKSANNIHDLIYGCKNLHKLFLYNIKIPISFTHIESNKNKAEKSFAIGLSSRLSDTEFTFRKDIVIQSPIIKFGSDNCYFSFEAIKGGISEKPCDCPIIDMSLLPLSYLYEGENYNYTWKDKTWGVLYDNKDIKNYIYIDFKDSSRGDLRTSYNWNLINSLSSGGNVIYSLKNNSGDETSFGVITSNSLLNIENPQTHTLHSDNRFGSESESIQKTFYNVIRKLGAVDLMFGGIGGESSNDNPLTVKIPLNKKSEYAIAFLLGCEDFQGNEKLTDFISVSFDNNSSKGVTFYKSENVDSKYPKYDIVKSNDTFSNESLSNKVSLDSTYNYIVIAYMNGYEDTSEAVFKLTGNLILNGIVISDDVNSIREGIIEYVQNR